MERKAIETVLSTLPSIAGVLKMKKRTLSRFLFIFALLTSTALVSSYVSAGGHFKYKHKSHGFKYKSHGFGHKRHGFGHKSYGFGHKSHGFGHKRFGFGHKNFGFGHKNFGFSHRSYRNSYGSYNSHRRSFGDYSPKNHVNTTPYVYDAGSKNTTSQGGSDGWTALVENQPSKAINLFVDEFQTHPVAGIPKVGFALAIAKTGNLEKGIWAMRRAFLIDPASLGQLAKDERLHPVIDELLEQYEYESHRKNSQKDTGFMISALHYLKGDFDSAKIKRGFDNSKSNKNLQELIRG